MENRFALDVGTRNVVGLIYSYINEKIIIKEAVTMEHETRAMEDGQIHDISKVAKIVDKIKNQLEEKSGIKIEDVAVAVAGRSLVTHKGSAKKEMSPKVEISEEDVLELELAAIQNSLASLDENYKKIGKEYHCVGFTVSEYKLDGESIKNPVFQKGTTLEIEILATFLPRIVVDSMFTMAKKVGLEISNLTLEPIAAISVVIPEDLRKLNLALVDIGAGTSDIAITKDGKVVGYEMVPMAGDELTERIAEEFLLDFTEAEKVKRALNDSSVDVITYNDILGMEYELTKKEISTKLEEVITELGKRIADKILELNGKATQAVILIGGGSLVPMLKEKIAEAISLPVGRVAVRGTEVIKNFEDKSGILTTAEFVTPVGIANMAIKGRGFKIISVTINEVTYRVFSFKNSMSLMDAFLSAGIDSKELYSRHGNPVTFKLNGKLQFVKGEMGKNAIIKVNGEHQNLDYEIEDGYEIEIAKQRDGRDAVIRISEVKEKFIDSKINIKINGEDKELISNLLVNGQPANDGYIVKDRDEITMDGKFTLKDILPEGVETEKKVVFYLNGSEIALDIPLYEITRGEKQLHLNDELFNGDDIKIVKLAVKEIKIEDVVDSFTEEEVEVFANETKINFGKVKGKVFKNLKESTFQERIFNGDRVDVMGIEENLPMVSDIFRFHEPEDLGVQKKGGVLRIEVNGKPAEFTTKLRNRDRVKLYHI